MKLAIVVDGGNVQSIYTDRPDIPVEIDLVDLDNLKAEVFTQSNGIASKNTSKI